MILSRASLAVAVLALGLSARPLSAAPEEYEIDPEHLTIAFLVSHLGYAKTLGFFREAEGSFVFDEETLELSDLEVEIEADSVFTNNKARDKHLRGSDFLDADEYEEITFKGTGSEQTGPRTGRVTGDLTLRGQTRPVTLEVVWNKSGDYPFGHKDYVIGISARTTIKRSDFGMTYAVENGFVGDEVEIIIEFEARRD